jgi:hypothetical protein
MLLSATDNLQRFLDSLGQRDCHILKPFFQHNALLPDVDPPASVMGVIGLIPSIVAAISSTFRSNLGESILVAHLSPY